MKQIKNNENKKTMLQRFIIGIQKKNSNIKTGIKVYNTPTLPENVVKFNHNILVRMFRVLGGICLLLTLSKSNFKYNEYIIYSLIFVYTIFLIY